MRVCQFRHTGLSGLQSQNLLRLARGVFENQQIAGFLAAGESLLRSTYQLDDGTLQILDKFRPIADTRHKREFHRGA